MRNWLAVGVVLGFVGSIVGGCSSGAPAETVADFCSQKAQLECSYVTKVCEGLTTGACVSYRTNVCETDAQDATESGLRQFNANNTQACLTAVTNTYGNLMFGGSDQVSYVNVSGPPGDTGTLDYICESVYQGQVQANGTCTTQFDCANGSVCTPANGGAKTDVCAPETMVADGMPCGAAGDICVSGDACAENKATGEYLCEPSSETLGGIGAPCTSDAQCDPNVAGFCDIYNTKTCQEGYAFGLGYDCELFGGAVPKG